ncbi:glycosyltransferase [soil metagenome]
MPTVLHVLEALEGGTARHLVDVVRHAHGVRHLVAIPEQRTGGLTDRQASRRLAGCGAEIQTLDLHRRPWSVANALGAATLRAMVRRRADMVHPHSAIGGLVGRLALIGVPVPCVYTPNGITSVRAGQVVERMLARRTDQFVAVSASEGELALSLGLVDRSRLAVIPNGVELEPPPAPLEPRAHLGLAPDAPLIGTIARLVPQKAPEDFVRAVAVVRQHHPAAHAVLVGDGPLRARVHTAIAELGLGERLHVLPELSGAAGVLGQLDVFALSSRFEGGPYAPLEAMRAGTPVVLTDVVGNRDVVRHGASGLLVPGGHPHALGSAISGLLADPAERHRLGMGGQARVRSEFDVRVMGARLTGVYRRLTRD